MTWMPRNFRKRATHFDQTTKPDSTMKKFTSSYMHVGVAMNDVSHVRESWRILPMPWALFYHIYVTYTWFVLKFKTCKLIATKTRSSSERNYLHNPILSNFSFFLGSSFVLKSSIFSKTDNSFDCVIPSIQNAESWAAWKTLLHEAWKQMPRDAVKWIIDGKNRAVNEDQCTFGTWSPAFMCAATLLCAKRRRGRLAASARNFALVTRNEMLRQRKDIASFCIRNGRIREGRRGRRVGKGEEEDVEEKEEDGRKGRRRRGKEEFFNEERINDHLNWPWAFDKELYENR